MSNIKETYNSLYIKQKKILLKNINQVQEILPKKINKRWLKTTLIVNNNLISSWYDYSENRIIIGSKIPYKRRSLMNKMVMHEILHSMGINHDQKSREAGYYTRLEQDSLSNKVLKVINFNVPTPQDYEEYFKYFNQKEDELWERQKSQAKYEIYCTKCSYTAYRKKESEMIKQIEKYHCPVCKAKLKIKKLT